MPRPVIPYRPTWLDQRFRASLSALPAAQQASCKYQLAELLTALEQCRHPLTDPSLKAWKPTAYHVAGYRPPCRLVEFRLAFEGFRVVVCHFDGKPEVLLAVATLTHDHAALKKLLRDHARRLSAS